MSKLDEMRQMLDYEPSTGVFTWKQSRSKRIKPGQVAGYIDRFGYRRIRIDGRQHQSHRLAWLYVYGEMPSHQIDHINGIRDDNRIANLRNVSQQENCRNRALPINNTSGVVGVAHIKANDKWKATIGVDGREVFLGYFPDKLDAIAARMSANNKYKFHQNHGKLGVAL